MDISLTKNYCITISIHKISSVHIFILKIQQILGFHDLKGQVHWITESTFSFPEFVPRCKKSVYAICSFWDTDNFRVPWPDWPHPFLIMLIQNVFDQLLIFVNLYQHVKNQLFNLFVLKIQSILKSRQRTSEPIFLTIYSSKIFKHLLICMILYQNQLIPSVHSSDTVSFRVQRPDWPHSFLTMSNQKIFDQLLIFVNLYQHAKNEVVQFFVLEK